MTTVSRSPKDHGSNISSISKAEEKIDPGSGIILGVESVS